MRKTLLITLTILALCTMSAFGQANDADADRAAIKQASLDYIEGWYEWNGELMERALHPDLAKRIVRTNKEGQSQVQQMTSMQLVEAVKGGGGKKTPKEQ